MREVVKERYFGTVCKLTLGLFVLLISCSREAAEVEYLQEVSTTYSLLELEILSLVNEHRISTGKNELKRLDEVSNQASLHTGHMLKKKEVCHHNFGKRYQVLKEIAGAKAMGENVGFGYRTSDAFVRAWLKSPNHRKIIEGENTHFGISAKQGKDKTYVTLIFIRK